MTGPFPGIIALAPEELAEQAGLQYGSDERAGLRRQRCGRGFIYRYPDGRRVRDRTHLARIRDLVIPPAWTDVWICCDADGHLQATGRDDRQRKQYLEDGQVRALAADDVNRYLLERAGAPFTARFFRPWNATLLVASELCQNGHADSATQRKRLSAQAIRRAAEMLGNTATVCRNYYVHPLVIEAHLQGTLLERCRSFRPRRRQWSSPSEQLLQHLLNTPD